MDKFSGMDSEAPLAGEDIPRSNLSSGERSDESCGRFEPELIMVLLEKQLKLETIEGEQAKSKREVQATRSAFARTRTNTLIVNSVRLEDDF
jgi:hypothetical protein